MHFCMDELYAILYAIPFVGVFWAWLRAKIHHSRVHSDCSDHEGSRSAKSPGVGKNTTVS